MINRRELGWLVSCAWLATSTFKPQNHQTKKEIYPIISLNRLDALRFSIVVSNCSPNNIKIGCMNSVLGMDQFTFEIKTKNDLIVIDRHLNMINLDARRPIFVPAGGHHEFVVDLNDSGWQYSAKHKDISPASWKTVRVLYKRSEIDFQDHETQYELLTGELKSRWIDAQFPRRRFRQQWGEKLAEEMDKTKLPGANGTVESDIE